jgi:hypothetical protein
MVTQLCADVEIVKHEPLVGVDEVAACLIEEAYGCCVVLAAPKLSGGGVRQVIECHQRPNGGQR